MSTSNTAFMPDMIGNTVIVTGANSGIGLATARAFAKHGARVVLAVRDVSKGEQAAATIRGVTEVRELDLANLKSIRTFATGWHGQLHVLERFLTSLSRRGFPRAWFSDSQFLLVLEAGMDGASIIGGSSG